MSDAIREVVAVVVDTPKKSQKVSGYKPAPGTLVALDYELGHYPFFVFGKVPNTPRVCYFPGGRWEFESGSQFPHFGDLDVLVGILKLAENERRNGVMPVITSEAGVAAERSVFSVKTSMRNLLRYCGRQKGVNSEKAVIEAIKKLFSLSATRHSYDGNIRTLRILNNYDYSKSQGKRKILCLEINNDFLVHCNGLHRMSIYYREVQNLKTQLEKGLFLFLSMNRKDYVGEARLLRFLGVVPPTDLPQVPSRKQREIYNIERLSYLNKKRKVISELINETIPALVETGFLANFNEEAHVKVCETRGKKIKYFLLYKNKIFGQVPIACEETFKSNGTAEDDF